MAGFRLQFADRLRAGRAGQLRRRSAPIRRILAIDQRIADRIVDRGQQHRALPQGLPAFLGRPPATMASPRSAAAWWRHWPARNSARSLRRRLGSSTL